jgi:uncharacterized membrane protein YgaE (UPF0421/DUF939 family)
VASEAEPRATPALLRLRNYTEDALKVSAAGPPWHRGVVAVVSVLGALWIGHSEGAHGGLAVGPALAVFMTLADTEGALKLRLEMLLLAALGMTVGGLLGLWLASAPIILGGVFLVLVALAGIGSFIGPPFQQAGRFCIIVGLLVSLVKVDANELLVMIALTAALVASARTVEHLIAPDQKTGDFRSAKEAVFVIRAGRWHLLRFVTAYVLAAAIGWVIGRTADAVHPTWVTVTVVVVMWADAHRSYQRVLQRVVGTLAGALVTLLLTSLVTNARVLEVIAAMLLFFLPHFIRRNYWLHTGLMVIFVMISLDLWSGKQFSTHLILERVGDVLLGCLLALLGTVVAFAAIHARIAKTQSDPDGEPVK